MKFVQNLAMSNKGIKQQRAEMLADNKRLLLLCTGI